MIRRLLPILLAGIIGAGLAAPVAVIAASKAINADSVTFPEGTTIYGASQGLAISASGHQAIVIANGNAGYFRVLTGSEDPTAGAGIGANPGSLYLRGWLDASNVNRGAVYGKTGPADTDWTLAAGTP